MFVYKFSECASETAPEITMEQVLANYKSGTSITAHDLIFSGVIRRAGWCFDFRNDLRQYVYKQYGMWHEAYAPNKTLLRKNVGGRVERIVDITKK